MPTPDNGGRWGVLGGSFDPVHFGHLNLAQSIAHKKKLDGVLLVPSFRHPFKGKNAVATYEHRLNMLQLAVKNYLTMQVSQLEKEQNLSGFTIDTLEHLKKRFPKSEFYFIIGADIIKELSKWHRAAELLKDYKFLAGNRPGSKLEMKQVKNFNTVELIEISELDISASNIRMQIKNGATPEQLKKLVPAEVIEYIFKEKLYQ